MNLRPKIAIIGGGLLGLSCADSLMSRDCEVAIFEAFDRLGLGASLYNSGMIHPSQVAPWKGNLLTKSETCFLKEFAERSKELLMEKRKVLGCRDNDRRNGTLQLFDSHFLGQKMLAYYKEIGVSAIERRSSWSFGRYALEFPGDSSGDAAHYAQLLSQDLIEKGLRVLLNHRAYPIIDNESVSGVFTNLGRLEFDHVVIACGAASADVLSAVDVHLPVDPVRGHALIFDRPEIDLPDYPIMHWHSHSALTVFNDQVRLSGTINEDDPSALIEVWEEIAPNIIMAAGQPKIKWSANRPVSRLGRPFISPTKYEGLWVNAGHGHMGWSMCTASGELLADMILEGQSAHHFKLDG